MRRVLRLLRSAMLGAEIASFGIPMTTLEELKLQQRQVERHPRPHPGLQAQPSLCPFVAPPAKAPPGLCP